MPKGGNGGSRRRKRPGSPPGTILSDPSAPPASVTAFAYGPGEPGRFVQREGPDAALLSELKGAHPVLWVDVVGQADEGALRELGEAFGLHPLALEDVVTPGQRAKVEDYRDVLFVVTRAAASPSGPGEQVCLFLGRGFVVSFSERACGALEPVRERLRGSRGRVRSAGPDYLAYCLLDAVVDSYFPALESVGERMEALLDAAEEARPGTVRDVRDAKGHVRALRHSAWPQREALGSLLRDRSPLVTEETSVYLRDCLDHATRVMEMLETHREQAADLLGVYMTAVSNRMNEVMKVLTIIATVFIPLTFIAGIYGMNFSPETSPLNMPELRWYWGYPFALGLMAACAAALVVFFKRKKWI